MSMADKVAWAQKMQGRGGRQRAVRSDLGTKRPRKRVPKNRQGTNKDRVSDDDGTDGGDRADERAETSKRGREHSEVEKRKRRRVEGALPPVFKSAEFVPSEDDDSE